jgi:hypothetical protein
LPLVRLYAGRFAKRPIDCPAAADVPISREPLERPSRRSVDSTNSADGEAVDLHQRELRVAFTFLKLGNPLLRRL